MIMFVYVVQDGVSRQHGELTFAVSNAAARRSFGEALSQAQLPSRILRDQLLYCVGSVDFDGVRPVLAGFEPELVCDGFEAASDFEEMNSENGTSV